MEQDFEMCKECKQGIDLQQSYRKGTNNYTGKCGMSITIFQDGRARYVKTGKYSQCPYDCSDIEYVEKRIKEYGYKKEK